jgi:8-oxo-dGTP pyrophosphatase MutT (NUDIX family)
MSDDDLKWRLGARMPQQDYVVFRTAFVEGEHPRTGQKKRFSLIDADDWVNVIALTRDERVVLVRQFRVGTAEVSLEIPGGIIDPGEEPLAAGARELREETGYSGGAWRIAGRVRPNPALQQNWLWTLLADGVELTHTPDPGPGEVLTVHTASLDEIQQKLLAGEVTHALVVTAFAQLAFRTGPLRVPR